MPLHADCKAVVCALDPFDDAVVRDGVGYQTLAEPLDRLVMSGVYL